MNCKHIDTLIIDGLDQEPIVICIKCDAIVEYE